MNNISKQHGVGLIEVLVSLVLLSVAVLGFMMLQMTSVQATDESLKRTQAMSIARGLSEKMRLNPEEIETMTTVINDRTQNNGMTALSCQDYTQPCTSKEQASKDALSVLESADDFGISVGIEVCPGTSDAATQMENSSVACVVLAWNTTEAFTEASTKTPRDGFETCADKNGIYKSSADCIMVEAY